MSSRGWCSVCSTCSRWGGGPYKPHKGPWRVSNRPIATPPACSTHLCLMHSSVGMRPLCRPAVEHLIKLDAAVACATSALPHAAPPPVCPCLQPEDSDDADSGSDEVRVWVFEGAWEGWWPASGPVLHSGVHAGDRVVLAVASFGLQWTQGALEEVAAGDASEVCMCSAPCSRC